MNSGGKIELFVSKILGVSSEYSQGWGAETIIGEPRVYPRYGDIAGSWASSSYSGKEWVELQFSKPIFLHKINIYETCNPGAICKISCRKSDIVGVTEEKEWIKIYSKPHDTKVQRKSRIFSPRLRLPKGGILTKEIRLDLHCFASVGWSEIDAVQIVGTNQGNVGAKGSTFANQMKSMLYDEVFPDVVFRFVSGREIKGHRGIIVARCPVFQSIFKKGRFTNSNLFKTKKKIEEEEELEGEEEEEEEEGIIENAIEKLSKEKEESQESLLMKKEILVVSMDESLDPEVFLLFLEFLYTDGVDVNEELLFPLFDLAGRFKMGELSEYLNKYCEFLISTDNVLNMVSIVRTEMKQNPKNLFLMKLKIKCLDFISDFHGEVIHEREFEHLEKDEILYVCRKISKDLE